jgi:FSR family fosmidomycin resistance protein-like MFS transporter
MASGGQHGLAQSLFQVGGNAGSALGPLLAALVVLPGGQRTIAWFSVAALLAIVVLTRIGAWYKSHGAVRAKAAALHTRHAQLSRKRTGLALAVLMALVFSKYFYLASLTSYYTFFLMSRFHVSVRSAQIHLFVFLGAVAAGTFIAWDASMSSGARYWAYCLSRWRCLTPICSGLRC